MRPRSAIVVAVAALALTGTTFPPVQAMAPSATTGTIGTRSDAGAASSRFFGGRLPVSAPPETRTIAPGVTVTSLTLGEKDENDFWTVHVYLPRTIDGPLPTADTALGARPIAERVADALREKGFEPRLEEVRTPEYADYPAGTLGWIVRVGAYETSTEAAQELSRLRAAGFAGGTRYTAQDGTDPLAPQKVHIMRIDFDVFDGRVTAEYGATLSTLEKLTDHLAETDALAGVNGQWFYDNAPGGLFVSGGDLLTSATNGRGGVLLRKGGRTVDVDTFRSTIRLRLDRTTAVLDAVNRLPGRVWNCGGIGGDLPTENPQHDLMCTDDSELVLFTPQWGPTTPSGAGAEVVLDVRNTVVAIHEQRGTAIPPGGSTIQATGDLATWLLDHTALGRRVKVIPRVINGDGDVVPLTKDTTIVQAGPTLVRDGRVSVNARGDGLIREDTDQTFTYNWVVRGNPRTMMGVDEQGRLMLVVVDGRQAGYSEGLGIAQAAELMKLLGAWEAVNLDGGGSSVMATSEGIVNSPSDATGQRSLGNYIVVRR